MHTVHSGKSLRGDEASLLRLSRKGEEKSVIAREYCRFVWTLIFEIAVASNLLYSEPVRPENRGSLCNRNPWPSSLIRAGIRAGIHECARGEKSGKCRTQKK